MTVEVEIAGRRHRVELERDGDRWMAIVNGRHFDVDAVRTPAGWSLLLGNAGESRASYDIAVDVRADGESVVFVNGSSIPVRVLDPRAWHRGAQRGGGSGASRLVTSAMPGRVVKVLVKPGDRVMARQGLVVVEAMKMENELRAPADAVVLDVKVNEGASIDAGAILVVLE